ncbi:creatininase family protein [Halopelagius longus]|uniref:Creatininase family protein n=1 Tax=Halopelagius longus TaxID=1236180 RepID=A0A1H0Z703_9EURY|nr:creatininase family protein [Halopelagius longus]RDI72863.1 creatininase family protein [Halopelagius longus]SDQ23215.1 creatinine amidohydrolase [Halopelagius longus]
MSERTTVRLAERTWPEVESALESGTRTAVVAVGSVEQHGPHLPLLMDTLAGDELSRRIAEKLGDALAAPTIRPGCSGHHMEFPGTITVPPETLMDLVRSYCESLDEHGFEFVVLVPTHGGNFAPVNTVAPEVARDIDANVIALADLDENMRLMNEGLRSAGVEYEEPVIHAGAAETAIVLAVNEGLVDTDELAVGTEGEISVARLLSEGFKSITENGVLGDPREATVEAGEEILETIATAYADRIEAERDAA